MPQFIQVLPGMRTLKTALAVFICIGIWRIWNDSMPFFAGIAAVITMQNSIENSVKVGIDRFIGTLVGAFVGGLLVWTLPINSITISLGIILVIHLTTIIKKGGSAAIASIVFLAITINIGDKSINNYIFMRVVETTLGIGIAVLINTLIKPPKKSM